MSETALLADYDWKSLTENLVTEDDAPVDNFFQAQQLRLLVEPLYTSWTPLDEETGAPRKFLATADVGIFTSRRQPPIVPDMFLSLDVEMPEDWLAKEYRSYFVWEFDKVPEVAVEIVSNKEGNELTAKLTRYAKIGVTYYVVFDPQTILSTDILRVYELAWGGRRYHLRKDFSLPHVGLNLQIWKGSFEKNNSAWLRWSNLQNELIPTGKERAEMEKQRAEIEKQRADNAEERAAQLAAKLREMGIDPTQI